MSIRQIILLIFVLFFVINTSASLHAEILQAHPPWHGKAFEGIGSDENIYLVKCFEEYEKTDGQHKNIFRIDLAVYSYCEETDQLKLWGYEKAKQNFFLYEKFPATSTQEENLRKIKINTLENNSLCTRLPQEYYYSLFLWTYKGGSLGFLKKRYLILPKEAYALGNKRTYFTKDELSHMRVTDKVGLLKKQEFCMCQAVYFDKDGYAYIQNTPICDRSSFPRKPFMKEEKVTIEPWRGSATIEQTGIMITETQPSQNDPEAKETAIEVVSAPEAKLKDKFTYDGKLYRLYDNYDYVEMNSTFDPPKTTKLTSKFFVTNVNISSLEIEYSPVACDDGKCSFYKSNEAWKSYLWKRDANANNLRGELIETGQHGRYSLQNMDRIHVLDSDVAKSFLSLVKNLNSTKKDEFWGFIDKNVFQSKADTIDELPNFKSYYVTQDDGDTVILDRNLYFKKAGNSWTIKQSGSFLENISPPTKQVVGRKVLSKENPTWHDATVRYFRVPIYKKRGQFAFQTIGDDFFLEKNYISNSQPIYPDEIEKIGTWIIVDDFFNPEEPKMAQTFKQFKDSAAFIKIIEERGGRQFFRSDLIRGATVKRIHEPDNIPGNSQYQFFSEIDSLVNLEDHSDETENYYWELHFFLARTTSGGPTDDTIESIRKKLKGLRAKRIVVWEFCDSKPLLGLYKTDYQKIFQKICHDHKTYKHILIDNEKEFTKISVPLRAKKATNLKLDNL